MKTMTCKQLGGACDMQFQAETFDEMAEKSKQHGMQMHESGDEAHQEAMKHMQELMQNPTEMQKWYEGVQQQFKALPEDA